jgi:hypothetical protein
LRGANAPLAAYSPLETGGPAGYAADDARAARVGKDNRRGGGVKNKGINNMKKTLVLLLAGLILTTLAGSGGCSSEEGFAIYLTRDDVPVSEMPKLSHVEIADEPIISIKDVISYTWETHEIELTAGAYERVMDLQVPTSGKSFVVCLDKGPIYWGAFWTPISSQAFDGVTIWIMRPPDEGNIIKLELGYPSPDFYRGEDPRSNPDIMKALEKAGKLK